MLLCRALSNVIVPRRRRRDTERSRSSGLFPFIGWWCEAAGGEGAGRALQSAACACAPRTLHRALCTTRKMHPHRVPFKFLPTPVRLCRVTSARPPLSPARRVHRPRLCEWSMECYSFVYVQSAAYEHVSYACHRAYSTMLSLFVYILRICGSCHSSKMIHVSITIGTIEFIKASFQYRLNR